MDTSAYTHLCRAGYASIVEKLAPDGVVLIPHEVSVEIEQGRDKHPGIPSVSSVGWVSLTVMTDDENFTAMQVKAALGGGRHAHRFVADRRAPACQRQIRN
jgi:hypothetical protein